MNSELELANSKDVQLVKTELGRVILQTIIAYGGSEEDLLQFVPLVKEFAGRAALFGINTRSDTPVYRLKSHNNIYDVMDYLFIHERLQFQLGHRADHHRMNDLWPILPLQNDAYCEVREIAVGDEASMLAQIENMDRVPAEVNYLLDLVKNDDLFETVKEHRNRLITTIHPTNHFNDDKYHSLTIEGKSGQSRSSHGGKLQLAFIEEGILERNYENEKILVLVRSKDLLPL